MSIEHCQFKKEIFNWKTVLWHNHNIAINQSAMLHKHQQNIILNVITT